MVLILVVLACALGWAWFHVQSRRKSSKLPPGPNPIPILGNILQLGRSPHISLAKLSQKYGPLIYLKLGTINTIVATSPEMAKLILQKHDFVFSSRTVPVASHVYDFHKYSMGFLPVNDDWRLIRTICKEHMLSTSQLDKSEGLRKEKVQGLCDYIRECCDAERAIDIGETAFTMTLGLMGATLFSHDFGTFGSDSVKEVRRMTRAMLESLATPNVADFFPILRPLDPQRIMRKAKVSYGKLLEFFQDIIDRRLASNSGGGSRVSKDFLDILIHLSQDSGSEFTFKKIKHLLLDLLVAATDTTSTTMEWALTELVANPEKLLKAQDELRSVVGEHNHVKESDLSRLPYFQAVVKETLRRHPPTPVTVARKALEDVEINGYLIPKDAQVFVNLWAIGRDSKVWSNPDSFEPERFINSNIDYKGSDYEFIPFSSGRRMCPGWPLGVRMVPHVVASLIHGFRWNLEGGIKPNEIDMTEHFGLSLEKAIPLRVTPVKIKPTAE